MAITFPDAPTLNQSYTAENGLNYIWDGEKWKTQGSYAADTGQYVLKDGSNTALFSDATSVGVGTTTPSETFEVSGGYTLAGGGLKVEGGTAGTDGSMYRVTANGGSYLVIEEETAYIEIGRREATAYHGLNFAVSQTSPAVADVHCANTYIESTIEGTANTYGFSLDVTDTITSSDNLYGVYITGSWELSEATNNYGVYVNIDTSTKGVTNHQIAAVGSADSYLMGNLGLGTTSPADKLEIAGAGNGIILSSPDGTRYRLTIANGGTVDITAV